jgi:hypothetical protein
MGHKNVGFQKNITGKNFAMAFDALIENILNLVLD